MHGFKKFFFQSIILLIVIGVAMYFIVSGMANFSIAPQQTAKKQLQVDNATITVEIASSDAQKKKGLGGRDTMGQDQGMLFVYDKSDIYRFWMKDMKIPLDFIWISQGKVADLIPNVLAPQKGTPDANLPTYQSIVPVDQVLEVNAGTIQRLQIKVGDTVKLN